METPIGAAGGRLSRRQFGIFAGRSALAACGGPVLAAYGGSVLAACGGAADRTPDDGTRWGYSGANGPENWGRLSEDYATCSEGVEQSPVDIDTGAAARVPGELSFRHGREQVHSTNTGLFVKVMYHEGRSRIRLGDREYTLVEVHAHTPGEHTIDGRSFPMEMHMVHRDSSGELAVAGLLFEIGRANPAVQQFIDVAPDHEGDERHPDPPTDLSGLLPSRNSHYSYPGSRTTPPCSEGVLWLVMAGVQEAAREQIDQISAFTSSQTNNRPVQPLGNRVVTFSG